MRSALLALAGALAISVPAVAAHAQSVLPSPQVRGDPFATAIAEAVQRFGVPEAWIRAVMHVESGGDRRAVSPKGAMGLMQLMPDTWASLRTRLGLGADPFDIHDNIIAGAAFLRDMSDRYGSPGFLAAYNAGPRRYEDYRDRHRPLPAETVAYVARLLPLIDGSAAAIPAPSTRPDPFAWMHAPIFIVRRISVASVSEQPSSTRSSSEAPAVADGRNRPMIAPRSDGLFVATSMAGPAQ